MTSRHRLPEADARLGQALADVATIGLLFVAGLGLAVGAWYWLGLIVVAALLAYEHSLIGPGDLVRLDAAFFTTNGVISVTFFVFVFFNAL